MHDPMVVAFEVHVPIPKRQRWSDARPGQKRWTLGRWRRSNPENLGEPIYSWWRPKAWRPRVAGRSYGWRLILTVWHVEPKGHDSGTVCPHYVRWRNDIGDWQSKPLNGWRGHVHHWHLQVPPLQDLRRRLFQRCEWCGGRSTKKSPVNISFQWDAAKVRPWWKSRPGLYHRGCDSAPGVLRSCLCEVPLVENFNGAFGTCATCGKDYRGEAGWIGQRQAVAISGLPVAGTRWVWPSEVNCHDIEKRLQADRGLVETTQ